MEGKSRTSPFPEFGLIRQWHEPKTGRLTPNLPDYPNDLDAMHEAIGTLNPIQREDFVKELCGIICDYEVEYDQMYLTELFRFATATAAQLAEAFLRVKKLWVD